MITAPSEVLGDDKGSNDEAKLKVHTPSWDISERQWELLDAPGDGLKDVKKTLADGWARGSKRGH